MSGQVKFEWKGPILTEREKELVKLSQEQNDLVKMLLDIAPMHSEMRKELTAKCVMIEDVLNRILKEGS